MIFIIIKFAIGATTNFIGEYIASVLYNHIESDEPPSFQTSVFISSVVVGGFVATVQYKIKSLLAMTALTVGLMHATIDVVDRMMGGDGFNHETFIEDYIFDTIIVFYIVIIINKIYELLYIRTENKKFDAKIIGSLPLSIAINMYYNYRYASEEGVPR